MNRNMILTLTTALWLFLSTALASQSLFQWSPDRRLTVNPAASELAVNFARSTAVDPLGRVHVVWQDSRDGVPQVYYLRSAPGADAWPPAVRLSTPSAPAMQPAVAVSGSRIYAVWHRPQGAITHVYVTSSSNGGDDWSPPLLLSADLGGAHASVAAAGGRVDVVWAVPTDTYAEVFSRHSDDGGMSWRPLVSISEAPFDSWVPTIAAAGQTVWVGWVDYRDGNEEEYLRISEDGGRTWGNRTRLTFNAADSWAQTLAVEGDVVHLTWFDRRNAGATDVTVERALNQALQLVGLEASAPPPRNPAVYYLPLFQQRIQEKLARVHAAAPDWVAAGGDPAALEAHLTRFQHRHMRWLTGWEVYYKRSTDRGITWTADRRLTAAPMVSARPSVAVDGDDVHIVWFDARAGNEEIFHKYSPDGGQTWSADERLTIAPGASLFPTVALTPDQIHVVWYDARDGNPEIYTKKAPRNMQ